MTTKVTSSLINSVANTQITGTITNAQLAGSITADKITSLATTQLTGTITNAQLAGSITADKITSIANTQITGTITNAQLAGSITANKITSLATTQLTGTITNAQLAGSITSDKITSLDGTKITGTRTIPKDTLPTGSIIQVAQTLKTDSFSTTSGAWVDVTGLSVSITPTSSTSKILIIVNCPGGRTGSGSDAFGRLMRDAVPIGNGNSGYFTQWAGQYGLEPGPGSRTFLDSPATTSTLTYKVQVYTAGDTIFIGTRRLGDFIFGCDITVMEIAA